MGATSAKPPEHVCLFILVPPTRAEPTGPYPANLTCQLLRRSLLASIGPSTSGPREVKPGSSVGGIDCFGVTDPSDGP